MYSPIQLAIKYLQYWLKASNGAGHGTHSPFVFQLIREVLQNSIGHPEFSQIEAQRHKLLQSKTWVHMVDFGAGSRKGQQPKKQVKDIARHSLKPVKYARLLHRLAVFLDAKSVLELGTSLGITTAYLAAAVPGGKITTLEGNPGVAHAAADIFQALGFSETIEQKIGRFDDCLPDWIAATQPDTVDFVYIDGNHRYLPTMHYARALYPMLSPKGVMVFDDIHWSREMEQAWDEVVADDAYTCTIDLFFIGLAFKNPSFRQKQHFIIRY